MPCSDEFTRLSIRGQLILVDRRDSKRIRQTTWNVSFITGVAVFKTKLRSNGAQKVVTLQRFILERDFRSRVFIVRKHEAEANDYRRSAFKVFSTMSARQAYLKKTKRDASSRYKGVSYCRRSGKWRASIRPHSGSLFLGEFNDEVQAALAYNEAALKYFGADAFQNDIATAQSSLNEPSPTT